MIILLRHFAFYKIWFDLGTDASKCFSLMQKYLTRSKLF